ncbi:MAG: hypothetical protein IJF58_01815 [Clostridia bacterium]|nr:hypothetical protein [Clostridia bacterium]
MKKILSVTLCIVSIIMWMCSCTNPTGQDAPFVPSKEEAIRIVDSYANDAEEKCSYSADTTISISSGTSTTEIKSQGTLEYEKQGEDYKYYNYTSSGTIDGEQITTTTAFHDGVFYYSNGKKIQIKSVINSKQFKEYLTFGTDLPGESKDFNSVNFSSKDDKYTLTMSGLKPDALIKANTYLEKELGYLNGMVDTIKALKIVAIFNKDFKLNNICFTIECESELGVLAKLVLDMADFKTDFDPSAPKDNDSYKEVAGAQYYAIADSNLSSLPYANSYKAQSNMTTVIRGCINPYESSYKMTVEKNKDKITATQEMLRGDEKGTVYSYSDKTLTIKNSRGTQIYDVTPTEAQEFALYCVIPVTSMDFESIENMEFAEDQNSKTIKIVPSAEYGCSLLDEISKLTYSEHSAFEKLKENIIEITFSGNDISGVKYRFTTNDGCVAEYILSYTYVELSAESI